MWNEQVGLINSVFNDVMNAYARLAYIVASRLSPTHIKFILLTNSIVWIAAWLAGIARFSARRRAGHILLAEFSIDLCAAALVIGLVCFVDVELFSTEFFRPFLSVYWVIVLPLMAILGLLLTNRFLHEIIELDDGSHIRAQYFLATISCFSSAVILILGSGLSWQQHVW